MRIGKSSGSGTANVIEVEMFGARDTEVESSSSGKFSVMKLLSIYENITMYIIIQNICY